MTKEEESNEGEDTPVTHTLVLSGPSSLEWSLKSMTQCQSITIPVQENENCLVVTWTVDPSSPSQDSLSVDGSKEENVSTSVLEKSATDAPVTCNHETSKDDVTDEELEDNRVLNKQLHESAPVVRARAGMERNKNGFARNAGCCTPCRRSTCGSPWPTDVIQAQIAACAACPPPCPPPCCSMRYCPCPPPGVCVVPQPSCNGHPSHKGNRHHSGSDNGTGGMDPGCGAACAGSFDVEEAVHHKYRDVSKDECGSAEVSENECRQRRQFGGCSTD